MRHSRLVRDADDGRRLCAVRAGNEFLNDVGIREAHRFEQIAAFERRFPALQKGDREVAGCGDPEAGRIDQQRR